MKHARSDYDRIQDPEGKIGEDEPVLLFRAQDCFFIDVLEYYANRFGPGEPIRVAIQRHIEKAQAWQAEHGTKHPDL